MTEPDTAVEPTTERTTEPGPTPAPRAPLRDLWPYLRPHVRALAVVVAVSLVGAALFLAQPAVVSRVIDRVSEGQPLRGVVLLLLGLLAGRRGALGGVQQYLLQRTAEAVVLRTRQTLIQRLLRLPIREYDTPAHR